MESKRANQVQTLEDRDNLGLRLLWSQPIQEKVNIRGWESEAVEVFAKGPLGSFVGIGYWQKAGQN